MTQVYRRVSLRLVLAVLLAVSTLIVLPGTTARADVTDVSLSEIRRDQPSSDNDEYFELAGPADQSLDGLTYIVIGDDSADSSGVIEAVVDLSGNAIPASGFFVAAESTYSLGTADLTTSLNFENNDNVTHMLVQDFTGAVGDDLDTNDDGVFDIVPFSAIVDSVAIVGPGAGNLNYSTTDVGPDGDFHPAHVFDCGAAWQIGGFTLGTDDTPGAANSCTEPPPNLDLLITEIAVTPTAGEFIEIFNRSTTPVDLTDVYITDASFVPGDQLYYNIVSGNASEAGGGGFGDWHARFPAGATIAPGEFQTIALNGAADFAAAYGLDPTYELYEVAPNSIPDLLEALPGTINGQGGLSGGEVVVLYHWDGATDLVQDIDYALWGDKNEAVDKTGAAEDGPDADSDTTPYLPDTAVADQEVIDAFQHPAGQSMQRVDFTEGTETQTGGNGFAGSDETSENLSVTWDILDPTPGGGLSAALVINEVDYDQPGNDGAEFIELKNTGEAAIELSEFSIELINGNGNVAYQTIALPSAVVSPGGFYVICASPVGVPNCDLDVTPDDNLIQNGPDAVALTSGGLVIDTVAYEGTVTGYTEGSPVNPADNNTDAYFGISRIPDGTDTDDNSVDFAGSCVTPGAPNSPDNTDCPDPGGQPATCFAPATLIHEVQGAGDTSPLEGAAGIVVEGVVVGDFQDTTNQLSGYFLQEEDGQHDGDPMTSEGIFVFDTSVDVEVGQIVRVQGDVAEFNGLTEITNVSSAAVCGPGVATAADLDLPVAHTGDFEWYEGMLVTIDQTLYASDNFNLGRRGEVAVSVNDRLFNPTNVAAPGAPADAVNDLNDRSRITLDDGNPNQNVVPLPPYFAADGTLRSGDTAPGVTGVVDAVFGYRIHPTQPVEFTRANARPVTPPNVGGDITVASFNVLNLFSTIDTPTAECFPSNTRSDCRGADTPDELDRQLTKIVAAISIMDADIVGLMEIENNESAATEMLVDALNVATAPGTYDFIDTGFVGVNDPIKVAIIYQPASVTPVGAHAVLDATVDPTFNDDRNRPALAQTFADASGELVTIAVNHLKSKGSGCDDIGDPDAGDQQGNCNGTRTAAAVALANWLATDPTESGSSDVLIIGDLNAYAMEDPVTALEDAGYTDLVAEFDGPDAYSFVFFGEAGYLDHGLASPSILPRVTGTAIWHINADEPNGLDYNNFNQPELYKPDPYRSSDHDPVIIGLRATTPGEVKASAAAALEALLPTGDSKDDKSIQKAIDAINDSLNPEYWADGSYLSADGKKVFDAEKKAVKELGKVKGSAAGEAQAVIDRLVDADAKLAQGAIDIAIAVNGKQKEIDKALDEMTKAAEDLAKNKPDKAVDHYKKAWEHASKAVKDARFATFNASLNRGNAGQLAAELAAPGSAQPSTIAEIIQRTRPEVLLINEFDYDAGGVSAALFQENYLSVSQGGADPIDYPFRYTAPSNTGVYSGFDLDNSGAAGDFVPNDSFGFGFFPGQFGMVVYSMYPIDLDGVRTFQNFLWKDMPGALLPENPPGTPWYSEDELGVFRLSSKSHWDLPLVIGDETVHFLVSHPTPPVFDGPEDRNGTRNHDEIRLWADYISGGDTAAYIYDDNGGFGGLAGNARFVIAGDQNSDPLDGDSIPGAIQLLLDHPKVNTKVTPSSAGATEQSLAQGGINATHLSDPAFDTADFSDSAPGNLRADYVLPSKKLKITDAAVFWPESTDPLFSLVGTFPFPSSDHRLVWIDVNL